MKYPYSLSYKGCVKPTLKGKQVHLKKKELLITLKSGEGYYISYAKDSTTKSVLVNTK